MGEVDVPVPGELPAHWTPGEQECFTSGFRDGWVARGKTVVTQEDSVLLRAEADIARMPGLDKGVRGTLAQIARRLAKRMDEADENTSETAFSGLAQQLRTTMMALTEVGSDGTTANALYDRLSTPVRDTADARPDDAGPPGGADSGDSREAADAVAKGTSRRRARSRTG